MLSWLMASPRLWALIGVLLSASCGSSDQPAAPAPGTDASAGGAGGSGGSGASAGSAGTGNAAGAAGTPDSGITPSDLGARRMFIPRIVPDDSSQQIWNYKQRAALLWFGKVNAHDNYTDVRIAYANSFVMIHCAVFDRQIYDDAQDDNLEAWDSIRLLVDLDGSKDKSALDDRSLRIDAQAHRQGSIRTAVYHGQAGAWSKVDVPIGDTAAETPDRIIVARAYRGEGQDQSRGWHISFYVPWTSLGLSGPPSDASAVWNVALRGFDRDSADGSVHGEAQSWPPSGVDDAKPSTWGKWEFLPGHFLGWAESGSTAGHGKPAYAVQATPKPYQAGTEKTLVIRQGVENDVVQNACVGASAELCSGNDDSNFGGSPTSWGNHTQWNYFHVQNQEDYADWPCFAKIYLKFPLARLPKDKVVVKARLLLHHKEPTSGGSEGANSLIQAWLVGNELRSGPSWTQDNLSWNDAPIALENLAGCWGDRTGNMETGWNALPLWEWDVTRAFAQASSQSEVSFALYSADSEYHTGKQFVTGADFPDWGDPGQRPSLEITYADPTGGDP